MIQKGDLVKVVHRVGASVGRHYYEGDVGCVLEVYSEREHPMVLCDFSGQGNKVVEKDGVWFVVFENLDVIAED